MVNLVCLDRDGTVNEDDNYYLGSSPLWREQARILSGVSEGIRKLNALANTEVFIVTNQSGVAIDEPQFAELTEERMHEVNRHILRLLADQGARVRGYEACPFVDLKYVKKAQERGWKIHPQYVMEGHRDLKPNIGMLEKCASQLGRDLKSVSLFVIGDRASDVELGLNGGGTGILVSGPKTRELGDVDKVRAMQGKYADRIYIAQDFLDAARYIGERNT